MRLSLIAINDEWASDVGRVGAVSSQLLSGIQSSQAEPAGWNAIISRGLVPTDLTRVSDTLLSISVPQFAAYAISVPETVSLSIPAGVLRSGQPITAWTSFVVQALPGMAQLHGPLLFYTRERRFQAMGPEMPAPISPELPTVLWPTAALP